MPNKFQWDLLGLIEILSLELDAILPVVILCEEAHARDEWYRTRQCVSTGRQVSLVWVGHYSWCWQAGLFPWVSYHKCFYTLEYGYLKLLVFIFYDICLPGVLYD